MSPEFSLIERFFTRPARHARIGVGDDAAVIAPSPGSELTISTDTLVAGNHFFADTEPDALGWKTLAVNISDLAAMGAVPRWALLAVTLPSRDDTWLQAFADGFFACADAFTIDLVGGDVTRGPLALGVTIIGEAPTGEAITRAGAGPEEDLWISGQPGRAALALKHLRGETILPSPWKDEFLMALHRPLPRVAAGQALRGIASAMLDVSDGVLGDLSHLLERSGVGAIVDEARLPLDALRYPGAPPEALFAALLSGGDDYELLFSAPPVHRQRIAALSAALSLPFTRIGTTTAQQGKLLLRSAGGDLVPPDILGYDHFR